MTRNYNENFTISGGVGYVKSVPGVFKIVEFVVLIVSISCISEFVDTLSNSRGTWNFFLFAVVSSLIITTVTFIFFVLDFHEKLPAVDWALVVGIVYMTFTVLLLIAAAILADNVQSYESSGLCDAWAASDLGINCNNLIVSAVFAFVAMGLYGLDSLLHFWLSVVSHQDNTDDNAEETAQIQTTQTANEP